tara:strand:+ start:231 stop:503 length:273 start_codon:yes stop_codon:yes gene_type:complete
MEKQMFTIFDNVSKTYANPLIEVNNGTMMRGIMDMMQQNPSHPWAKFPDNYTLINIGTWNDEDGIPTFDKHTIVAELVAIKTPSDMIKEN